MVRRLPNAKVYGVTSSASFDFAMGEQAVAQAHTQGTPETVQRTKFMQGGEIVDVDGLEEVLEYLYAEELRLPAEEQPLLLVASDLQSKETREVCLCVCVCVCVCVPPSIGVPTGMKICGGWGGDGGDVPRVLEPASMCTTAPVSDGL